VSAAPRVSALPFPAADGVDDGASAAPRVSVILPAYYSDARIADCLEALRGQTMGGFEVVVVNSSPEERTGQIVQERFPEVIFWQSPRRLLPHAARNVGVGLATGQVLVFSDPDCVPQPDWLERLLRAHWAGHAVVQGSMALRDAGWLARGIHLCKWHALLPGLPPRRLTAVASGNACYAREAWEAAGPFAGHLFCGDTLLSWRAAARGYALWFEPRAVVAQAHPGSAWEFARERLGRGWEYGRVRLEYERWSRGRAALYLALLPLLPWLVLARAGWASARSGWLGSYLRTLPVQCVGQAAWSLGEARAHLGHLLRGASRSSLEASTAQP